MEIFALIGVIVFILFILLILRINKLNKSDEVIIKPPFADMEIKSSPSDNTKQSDLDKDLDKADMEIKSSPSDNTKQSDLDKDLDKLDKMFAELRDAQSDPDGIEVFNALYGLAIEFYYLDFDGKISRNNKNEFYSIMEQRGINKETSNAILQLMNDMEILLFDVQGQSSSEKSIRFTNWIINRGIFVFLLDEDKDLHLTVKEILTNAYSKNSADEILSIVNGYEMTEKYLITSNVNFYDNLHIDQRILSKHQFLAIINHLFLLHIPDVAMLFFMLQQDESNSDQYITDMLNKRIIGLYGLEGNANIECISGMSAVIAALYGFENNQILQSISSNIKESVIADLKLLESKKRLLAYCNKFYCEHHAARIAAFGQFDQVLTQTQSKELGNIMSGFGKIFIYYKFLINYKMQERLQAIMRII